MSVVRCTRRGCGTILVDRTDDVGRLVLGCVPCERNANGGCRDCTAGRLASPTALRCPACLIVRNRLLNVQSKRRALANPVRRQRILEQRRQRARDHERKARVAMLEKRRRDAQPKPLRTDIDRAYGRAWYAARSEDAAYREAQSARRRELRAEAKAKDSAAYQAKLARQREVYALDMQNPLLLAHRQGRSHDYYERTKSARRTA